MFFFLKVFFAKKCRPFYCILFGRRTDTHLYLRYFCRFICGLIFAYLFWRLILLTFSLSSTNQHKVLFALIAIVGFGFIFSTSIRCVTLLIFVGMVGKSGRSYLRALSFAFIIGGPIANLSENGAEIVRIFTCSTTLQYNLTKARFDLMTKPFQNTLKAMKGDIKDVKEAFADIRNVLEPLRDEVEGKELEPKKKAHNHNKNSKIIESKNVTFVDKKNSTFVGHKNSTFIDQKNRNLTLTDHKNSTSANNKFNDHKNVTYKDQKNKNETFVDHKNTAFIDHKINTYNQKENTTFNDRINETLNNLKTKPFAGGKNTSFVYNKNVKTINKKNTKHKRYKRRHHRQSSGERAAEIQQQYAKKFERRCKYQLAKGEQRCKAAFRKAHDSCKDKFPRIIKTLLCWPFRVDFICNFKILGDPDTICDPTEALPKSFGSSYQELEEAEDQLYTKDQDLEVNYKIHQMETPAGLKTANETAALVMSEFKKKKTVFDHIMSIMQKCLSFLFLRVVFASMSYRKKYINEISFDNLYLSQYFKHVDKRRVSERKPAVLPLRKYEKKDLIDTSQPCVHTKDESKAMVFHFLQFSLEIITSILFLMLDYFVVTMLQIIRARSAISYIQEGEHTIKFHITGTGLMARLMRTTLRNFNMHEKVNTFLTNEACLPKPSILPNSFYIKLVTLYATIIILIYKSSVFLRLRRLICAYFYRKREKHRILFLFNSLLRQRRSLFKAMLKNAQDNAASREVRHDINLILKLRLRCPLCFNWLKFFNVARRKCLICDDYEDDNFVECSNPQCIFVYCSDCWREMENYCLICNYQIKKIKILNYEEFFEDYSEN